MARRTSLRGLALMAGLLVAAALSGCGGGGGGGLSLTRSGAAVTLEVQSSTAADFGCADNITLKQTTVDGELRCEITAIGARDLKGLFCELRFDPQRLTPLQAEPTGLLGGADETLTLAAMYRGRLMFSQARVRPERCKGFSGDGVLARVRFAWRAYDETAAAGIACRREVCDAPVSELSASAAYWTGGDIVEDWRLNWDYASQGDYDQNSETGAPDLAPLAAHFGESAVPDKFERSAIQSVIDGDNNGELGAADLVPIAQNFGNVVEGYNVYISNSEDDYPTSAETASTIDPLGNMLKTEADGNPLGERQTFAFPVSELTGVFLWVRPYHGGHEGVASNLVDLGGLGPILALVTEADGGAGTEADPYIVDTATDYVFSVTDPVAGDVTQLPETEFTVSEDTAGEVDAQGMLNLEDEFVGDFTVSATFDGTDATPVLYFRVIGIDSPILEFSNYPDLGTGVLDDPFIVDTATVYQFTLFHILDGFVGGSAETVWTVSDALAGSILKGSPATLDIVDSYTGTFTVGATYNGVGSWPALFYLRVPEAGTPLLSLASPPINGTGQDFDPYEVDNAQDYTLLLDVNGSDAGVDAATIWTLSDAAAGTVDVSGAQAVLQIEDGYTDVFSVGAAYNGTASVPDVIWLDGTPSGLPEPPVADLQVSPGTNVDDYWTEFIFDASGSTATMGSIDFYSWDCDGDGYWEISETSTATLTHTYGYTGVFSATVRVTDDRGATDTASVEITVTDNGNFHPTASLLARVGAGEWLEDLTAEVPVTVDFDASGSSDPDGPIDHYLWDLHGDGVFEDLGTSAQQSHSYTEDGIYYLKVQAYDGAGDMDTAIVELTLTQPGGNMTPQASLQAAPTFGTMPLAVSFDASLSSDPNNDTLSFEWDWDGDGTYDYDSGTTPTADHTYDAAGDYTAVVKVSDPGGLFDTDSVNVTVDDGTASWHFFDVAVPDGTTYSSMGEGCSLAVVDGFPGIAFLADIEDDEYSPKKLMFVRATDADGTSWGTPVNVHAASNNWDEIGFSPELEIVGGMPAVAYATRRYSGSWYYRIYACTAADAQGSAWGSPQTVAGGVGNNAFYHLDVEVVDGTLAAVYYMMADNTLRYRRATDTSGENWDTEVTVEAFTFSGTPQTVDPSLAVVNGNPAVAYFFYTDGDISIPDELHYTRATDATGSVWGSPQALAVANGYGWHNNLIFQSGAPLLATVDNSGMEDSTLKSMRGIDADGTAWGAAVTVYTASGGWWAPFVESVDMAVIGGKPAIAFFVDDLSADLFYVSASNADGTSWHGAQLVLPNANGFADELSLAEVNGHPAIAFAGEVDTGDGTATGLRYAAYY